MSVTVSVLSHRTRAVEDVLDRIHPLGSRNAMAFPETLSRICCVAKEQLLRCLCKVLFARRSRQSHIP